MVFAFGIVVVGVVIVVIVVVEVEMTVVVTPSWDWMEVLFKLTEMQTFMINITDINAAIIPIFFEPIDAIFLKNSKIIQYSYTFLCMQVLMYVNTKQKTYFCIRLFLASG